MKHNNHPLRERWWGRRGGRRRKRRSNIKTNGFIVLGIKVTTCKGDRRRGEESKGEKGGDITIKGPKGGGRVGEGGKRGGDSLVFFSFLAVNSFC